jgi:hypothetical protein
MTSIFNQWDHDPEPFAVTGAAETTSVALIRPLTIYYVNGSSDTIPTGTVAVLADGVTTTFNRSQSVYIIYTVPGSGLLYAILESQVAGLTGDYALILTVLRHEIEPYQPMQPSGQAGKAGAWSGGVFIGGSMLLVKHNGTTVGQRSTLNLIDGSNVTLTIADDSAGNKVDVTIASTGGGGASIPAVSAYSSVDINIPTDTNVFLPLDTTEYDLNASTAQHSTTTHPSRLTCQQAGVYHITAWIQWVSATDSATRFLNVQLNTEITIVDTEARGAIFSGGYHQQCSIDYFLNVGDYLEIMVNQASGSTSSILGTSVGALDFSGPSPKLSMFRAA